MIELPLRLPICSALSILLYRRTVGGLIAVRSREEDRGHGFLLLPISLHFVLRKRGILCGRPVRPDSPGLVLLFLGAVLCITGVGAEISALENISVIVFLLGAVLFMAGRDTAKALLFPVLLPAFMSPMPAETHTSPTNPPAPLTAACPAHILRFVEIPVLKEGNLKEGNLINPPDRSMEAAPACSGMRFLIPVIALALLMGYVFLSSNVERLVLVLSSLPAALLGNVVGTTAEGFCTHCFSSRVSRACLHTTACLSFLAASLVCLLCFCLIIRWVQRKRMQYLSWLLR